MDLHIHSEQRGRAATSGTEYLERAATHIAMPPSGKLIHHLSTPSRPPDTSGSHLCCMSLIESCLKAVKCLSNVNTPAAGFVSVAMVVTGLLIMTGIIVTFPPAGFVLYAVGMVILIPTAGSLMTDLDTEDDSPSSISVYRKFKIIREGQWTGIDYSRSAHGTNILRVEDRGGFNEPSFAEIDMDEGSTDQPPKLSEEEILEDYDNPADRASYVVGSADFNEQDSGSDREDFD